VRLLFNCTGTTVIPIVITSGNKAAAGKPEPDVSDKAAWFLATIKSGAITSTSESQLARKSESGRCATTTE
jgi:hypothetical protein